MRRPSRRPLLAGLAALAGALFAAVPAVPAAADDGTFTVEDPRITESSGLAASRQHPGVYWTHNDSDDGAFLYAVDSRTGKTVATVTMTGVGTPRDVEAVSIGPDGHLYVGDIGDNLGGTWQYVWIYELPEPEQLKDQTVRATQYVVKYEDGARDAEALMVHPKTGRVYIADKNDAGGSLYEGPAELSASGTNTFRKIASVPDLEVTDGAFSPDGKHLALRSYFGAILYDWNGGKIKKAGRLSVPLQRQGESLTYTTDGSKIMYGSEGGGSTVVARDVPGGSGDGGSGSSSADGGGSSAGQDADGTGPGFKVGAIAVAGAVVVIWGFRRVLRRPS
ncbi:WD40 repeat domain-containing protein [Streptomyces heilongjiangensis]|uniref:WD40 repeat domain-containing protein n=1 Tax=Streptomyces heilongjiangensis TaxID=945052 RepID=A0ABW1B3B4_9ACTN|nr:WD40 repeat domain-containing protein [Streptomyces heilongjiangensis]MDC2946828.1 WD40 repeat domain-containing protein [Streptomyces heilongjiangensis]